MRRVSTIRQVFQKAKEGHALAMSKQFGTKAILWLAGGSSVVELCNCALGGFSLQSFCYSQLWKVGEVEPWDQLVGLCLWV